MCVIGVHISVCVQKYITCPTGVTRIPGLQGPWALLQWAPESGWNVSFPAPQRGPELVRVLGSLQSPVQFWLPLYPPAETM